MQTVPYTKMKKFIGSVRPCAVCGNNSNYRKNNIWAKDNYFRAIECENCSFVSIDPCISEKGLTEYYQFNMNRRLINKKKIALRNIEYLNDKKFIERVVSSGKVLDVGCGGGVFLSKLSKKFIKYGLDIDKTSAQYGRKKFKIKIVEKKLGEDNFKKNYFDLIIFRGVIEHLYDPKSAVNRAHALLKKNGHIIFCATPNLLSFPAWLYRSKWNLWHPIQHINIFSAETLWKMCGKKKFIKVDEKYPYLETPYANKKKDYIKIITDIKNIASNKNEKFSSNSPPFWGNMLSLILKKK